MEQWPLSRVLRNENVRNLEVRMRRIGSDRQRIFSHSGAIVREPSGKQIAFLTINDVTERKKAEQRLILLDTSVSNLNDIVLITDAEPIDEPGPRIVFVNAAFERITGYASSEALGRSPRFLAGAKTDRRILAEIRQALMKRQPIRRQIINCRKDGTEYWLDTDIVPIFDAAGKCTHFAAIGSDITEEKKTEEQIAEQAALLDKTRDAIVVRDLKGKILFWNKGAERMYGWKRQEAVGRNIGELLYTNPKKFEELNELTISQGEWYGEVQQLTRDRTRDYRRRTRRTLIRDNEGHPKSMLRDQYGCHREEED